jgi:hypothetical protein
VLEAMAYPYATDLDAALRAWAASTPGGRYV